MEHLRTPYSITVRYLTSHISVTSVGRAGSLMVVCQERQDRTGRIEAFRLIPVGETDVVVHIKDVGDKEYKNISKDTILGTTGQNKRIEAIKITGKDTPYIYRVHQKNIGWTDWTFNGFWAGTKGKGLQIEAIEIMAAKFLVNPHVQNRGWLGERACENIIGITGHNLRLEAFLKSIR